MFPQPMIPILSLFMSNPPFMIDYLTDQLKI
jgi:hypothetical protein